MSTSSPTPRRAIRDREFTESAPQAAGLSVCVLGGGSFGTAIASIAADNGASVTQWMRDAAQAKEVNTEHRNSGYLPGFVINSAVRATTDMADALAEAELVCVAIPSKAFRTVVKQAREFLRDGQILVATTKGIESEGFTLMSEVLEEETGFTHIGVLSGPNLATEIAQRQLTATVIASDDPYTRARVQTAFGCDYFRVYASNDR
jgi:glycerol-3-phosphate dehydrogenase (NAD(P)+)